MSALKDILPDTAGSAESLFSPGHRGDLVELQLAAASERFDQLRPLIPALDRRAESEGITAIDTREALVPLLFAHSVYKSYPEGFVTDNRLDRLSMWLSTVSAQSPGDVDMTGVGDVDGWVDRLAEAGLHLVVTSGTSGKQSFLPMSAADLMAINALGTKMAGFPYSVADQPRRPVFMLGPGNAPTRFSYSYKANAEAFGRPGHIHCLTDERVRIADAIRSARIRKASLDGTASPADLANFQRETAQRAAAMESALVEITERILDARSEPTFLLAPWATFWRVLTIARDKGIGDGTFHPDTAVSVAGGLKGLSLPEDYDEQANRFLGPVHRYRIYGMSEIASSMPMCDKGVYHCPPWLMLFILDESGERLVEVGDDGRVRGRVGVFDMVWSGRWGGLVTGDQATVDYVSQCPCGLPGPFVEHSVVRYSELSPAGDDKLTCGGTIEQYIRGVVS